MLLFKFIKPLLAIVFIGLSVSGCSETGNQFDPPKMVFAGAEDYSKGLVFLQNQDVEAALPWLRKAIAQDNPEANYQMGLLYARGDHVVQDYTQARDHFNRSAKMGHPKALYYLGHMYGEGSGVEQNYAEALKWFWLSASYGDSRAKRYMRVVLKKVDTAEYNRVEEEVKTIWKTLPHDVFLTDEQMALH